MNKFSAEKLRTLREHKKLTQEALAEKCGVDTTTISGWEKDKWEPSLQNALALAKALNVSVEDLCDTNCSTNSLEFTTKQIINCIKGLTPKEQEYILEMIQKLKELREVQ